MRSEIIHSVLPPILAVLGRVSGAQAKVSRIIGSEPHRYSDSVYAHLSYHGSASGYLGLIMDQSVAMALAGSMSGQEIADPFDPAIFPAILELANMVGGNTLGPLSSLGFELNISPPDISIGDFMNSSSATAVVETNLGRVLVALELGENHQ